jgi:hypothetical protein
LRILYLNRVWKMRIDPTARISMTAKLDKTHPRGVRIGERSYTPSARRSCATT